MKPFKLLFAVVSILALPVMGHSLTYDSGNGGSGSLDLAANYAWTGTHSWTQGLTLSGSGGASVTTSGSSMSFTVNGNTWGFFPSSATAPNGYIVSEATKTWVIIISSGAGWGSLSIPVFTAPDDSGITITKITAQTMPTTSTVTYQLDERAFSSLNSVGSSVFTVTYSSANNTGLTTTSFNDASIAAGSSLILTTPASGSSAGTPAYTIITITGKRQS
jgi:hypothetical protein